eukprot:6747307-Prymnesium_polylepis.1
MEDTWPDWKPFFSSGGGPFAYDSGQQSTPFSYRGDLRDYERQDGLAGLAGQIAKCELPFNLVPIDNFQFRPTPLTADGSTFSTFVNVVEWSSTTLEDMWNKVEPGIPPLQGSTFNTRFRMRRMQTNGKDATVALLSPKSD